MTKGNELDVPYGRLNWRGLIFFVPATFVTSHIIDYYLLPGRALAICFSIFMIGCAIWSAKYELHTPTVWRLLFVYIALHLIIPVFAPTDDQYFGALILPIAVLDYYIFCKLYIKVVQSGRDAGGRDV